MFTLNVKKTPTTLGHAPLANEQRTWKLFTTTAKTFYSPPKDCPRLVPYPYNASQQTQTQAPMTEGITRCEALGVLVDPTTP
eukprot:1049025-Karenia_brevis.AAC.1